MPKGVPISEELKNKVLRDIKENGLSVPKASQEYGIGTKSIYNWLNKNIIQNNGEKANYAEINRLKKDKEDLLLIIGELTKEVKDLKKKSKNGRLI